MLINKNSNKRMSHSTSGAEGSRPENEDCSTDHEEEDPEDVEYLPDSDRGNTNVIGYPQEKLTDIKFPKPPRKRKIQTYICEECGKLFNRADLLRNHRRIHSGDKPFTCEVCGDKFREQGHLRRHMTRHTGKKPYQCYICGKELNSSLAKHLRRHLNDRQFGCVMCEKKFVSGFELKQHILTHKKGTFQGNPNRGTPSLDKRVPKAGTLSEPSPDSMPYPNFPVEPADLPGSSQLNMTDLDHPSYKKFAEETQMAFLRRLVAQEDLPSLEQLGDKEQALANWEYYAYTSGMLCNLNSTIPQEVKNKSPGRKRLSDLPWAQGQSNDITVQNSCHKQSNNYTMNKEKTVPSTESDRGIVEKQVSPIDTAVNLVLKVEEKLMETQKISDKEELSANSEPSKFIRCLGLELQNSMCSNGNISNSDQCAVVEQQPDDSKVQEKEYDIELNSKNDSLSDEEYVPDEKHSNDSGSTTEDYEAEVYFKNENNECINEENKPEEEVNIKEEKKKLSQKVKANSNRRKTKNKRKSTPAKRRKKAKDIEEQRTTVCEPDSDKLFVLQPDEIIGAIKREKNKKDRTFVCEECGKVFYRADLLRNHIRVHTGAKPFICEVCGESFREQGHLRRHMTRHTGKKPYKCNLCGKELNSSLSKHMRRHLNDRQFPCTMCHKTFVSGFELKHHMIIHNKSEHIPCHICGKKFSHNNILSRHLMTHSNQRPFPCELCDKSYKSKQDLHRHKCTHLLEKSSTCHVCGKQFSQDRYLKRHIRRHENNDKEDLLDLEKARKITIKPYFCEVCFQRFTTVPNLKQHMKLHYDDGETYACYLCSKIFTQKRYLQRHIRRHNRKGDVPIELDEEEAIMGQMVAMFNEKSSKNYLDNDANDSSMQENEEKLKQMSSKYSDTESPNGQRCNTHKNEKSENESKDHLNDKYASDHTNVGSVSPSNMIYTVHGSESNGGQGEVNLKDKYSSDHTDVGSVSASNIIYTVHENENNGGQDKEHLHDKYASDHTDVGSITASNIIYNVHGNENNGGQGEEHSNNECDIDYNDEEPVGASNINDNKLQQLYDVHTQVESGLREVIQTTSDEVSNLYNNDKEYMSDSSQEAFTTHYLYTSQAQHI